jgi:hypothetical protein
MTSKQTDIQLTLDVQDGVVGGTVRGADGVERPFIGWLALIQAIDDLVVRSSAR